MGFFDEYVDEGGGSLYIKAEEKTAIAQAGIPFVVTGVKDDEDNVYNGKKQPRFVVVLELPDPETGEPQERYLSFPKGTGVDSRDKMLAQLGEYLTRDDAEEVTLKLTKVGRAYVLKDAKA